MKNKTQAINVLLSEEVNDGIKEVASNLGISKSRAVRFICMDYLTKQNLITIHEANTYQHL
jgi:predicted ArsR family transcriptional regulator